MKTFVHWLVAPWRGLVARLVKPELKAACVGLAATMGLLFGGWLLLARKERLEERSVLAVLVSPNLQMVSPGKGQQVKRERNSPLCREFSSSVPKVEFCSNWRRVKPPARTVLEYQYNKGLVSVTVPELLDRSYWTGDFEATFSAQPPRFRGSSREDALRSIGGDVYESFRRLAVPGGVGLAVMIGVSTGFHYLRKTRGEDDI